MGANEDARGRGADSIDLALPAIVEGGVDRGAAPSADHHLCLPDCDAVDSPLTERDREAYRDTYNELRSEVDDLARTRHEVTLLGGPTLYNPDRRYALQNPNEWMLLLQFDGEGSWLAGVADPTNGLLSRPSFGSADYVQYFVRKADYDAGRLDRGFLDYSGPTGFAPRFLAPMDRGHYHSAGYRASGERQPGRTDLWERGRQPLRRFPEPSLLSIPLPAMDAQLPLKRLHPDSSLSKSGLEYWRRQRTDVIVGSLAPGKWESLKAKTDGTVMDGNTRVKVLEERGYDVNGLPREPYP